MIRVLLAASSVDLQILVEKALKTDRDTQLAGLARSGSEAVKMARKLRPDLVAVGLRLENPHTDEVVKEIMIEAPAPIVMVAHKAGPELGNLSVQALASGALAVIPAPLELGGRLDEASTRKFLSTLKAMSQVRVVRRWRERSSAKRWTSPPADGSACRIVGIAASTGGPGAIQSILKEIPVEFPAPILVVQHISRGFIEGLAASLDAIVPLDVKVAKDGDLLEPGAVYIAPDDLQLGLASRARIRVTDAPPVKGFRPSATHLFNSIARVFGNESLAVVLTGMGNDGTEGLRAIRKANGKAIAQDEVTSVVFGMPKAAIDSGLVDLVLPLEGIAWEIKRLAGGNANALPPRPGY
jgi:two-component system, chemotaxis family, protein-glutamate methylesterase/glutaminase